MKILLFSLLLLVSAVGVAHSTGAGAPYPLLPIVTVVDSYPPDQSLDQLDIDDAIVLCGTGCNLYFPAGVYSDVHIEIGNAFPDGFAIYGDGRGNSILRGAVFSTSSWIETILIIDGAPDGIIIRDLSLDGRKQDQDPFLLYPGGSSPPTTPLNQFRHHGIYSRSLSGGQNFIENGTIQRVEIYNYFTRGIGLRNSPGWFVVDNVIHDIGCHVVDTPCGSAWENFPDDPSLAPGTKFAGFGIQILPSSDSVTVMRNRVDAVTKIAIEVFSGGLDNDCGLVYPDPATQPEGRESGASKFTWISDNTITHSNAGITINGGCSTSIVRNVISHSIATGGENLSLGKGISCAGGGGTNLYVRDNISTGNQGPGYSIACTGGNIVFENNVAGHNCQGNTGGADFEFARTAGATGSGEVLKIIRATNQTDSDCYAGMYIRWWNQVTLEDSAIRGGTHALRLENGDGIDVRRTTVTNHAPVSGHGVVFSSGLSNTYVHPSVDVTGYVAPYAFIGGGALNDGDDVAYCTLENPMPAECDP